MNGCEMQPPERKGALSSSWAGAFPRAAACLAAAVDFEASSPPLQIGIAVHAADPCTAGDVSRRLLAPWQIVGATQRPRVGSIVQMVGDHVVGGVEVRLETWIWFNQLRLRDPQLVGPASTQTLLHRTRHLESDSSWLAGSLRVPHEAIDDYILSSGDENPIHARSRGSGRLVHGALWLSMAEEITSGQHPTSTGIMFRFIHPLHADEGADIYIGTRGSLTSIRVCTTSTGVVVGSGVILHRDGLQSLSDSRMLSVSKS